MRLALSARDINDFIVEEARQKDRLIEIETGRDAIVHRHEIRPAGPCEHQSWLAHNIAKQRCGKVEFC